MLSDRLSGATREVDICIESVVAGHKVIVSVECRDHARVQDVQWVEQEHSKHQRLPTNLLVLASSSGFTKEALRVAEKLGIETVVPGHIREDFGESVSDRLNALWVKKLEMHPPTRVEVTVAATEELAEEWFQAMPNILIFTDDGNEAGTVLDVVNQIRPRIDPTEALRDATGDETFLEVVVDLVNLRWTATDEPVRLLVREDDIDPPVLRRVTRLRMVGPIDIGVTEVPMTYRELQSTTYAFGESEIGDGKVLVVITDHSASEKKASIRFKPKRSASATKGKRKR